MSLLQSPYQLGPGGNLLVVLDQTYVGHVDLCRPVKFCRSKVPFSRFKGTDSAYTYNFEISFVLLSPWTLLEVSARWEEQIWHPNIKSKELKSPVSFICRMSSSCMDLCTFFTIWDTHRALANCRHPTIFGTLAIFCSTVFLLELKLST